jgi:antitoxin ChpS
MNSNISIFLLLYKKVGYYTIVKQVINSMTQLVIRQSGGANIISIPKAVLNALDLHVSSILDLSIIDAKILLTPVVNKPSLEDLLKESSKAKFELNDEDHEWLNTTSYKKEIL